MQILYKKRFQKHYQKLSSPLREKVKGAILCFQSDPFDAQLRNHALSGAFLGYRSIDVTGDYRIVFRELSNGWYELIELVDVGTHSQLYG